MELNLKIYHYTTIENLALILKNKTLKFNSLSKVDDTEEGKTDDFGDLGKFIFVSCWSKSSEENIALWNMYSDKMTGIRLELDSDDITFKRLYEGSSLISQVINLKEHEYAWLFGDKNRNLIEVDYSKKNVTNLIFRDEMNRPIIQINNIAACKNKLWEFQEEVRFILIAAKTNMKSKIGILKSILYDSKTTSINDDCLYLQLSEENFKNLKILLGPKTRKSHEIICEALVEKFLPMYKIPITKSNIHIRD